MQRIAIAISILVILPRAAYAQCVRIIGTNQIVCPGAANSTPPVSTRGYYKPGPGAPGAAQMVLGAGELAGDAVAAARGRVNPDAYLHADTAINGYHNMQRGPVVTYQPPIAHPSPPPPPGPTFRNGSTP
jgi:hypothetical protein